MSSRTYPLTMKRGVLKGQTFQSELEYKTALKASRSGESVSDSKPSSAQPKSTAPAFSKRMVEALVKMLGGVASFTPWFRGDNALTDEESGWLVDDWYDFGKHNQWFARLVVQLFGVDLYGKLLASHVAIIGSRAVVAGALPAEFALVPLGAVAMRRALDGAVQADSPQESGEAAVDDLGLAAGSASRLDRQDGFGQELSGEALTQFAHL